MWWNRFRQSKTPYEQALKNSGFNSTLTYTASSQLKSSQSAKRKRQRKRNIIWFSPPFDKNVTTNIGRRFLELLDLHFHVGHPYHRFFNRNTVKVSYCCMPNMGSIISSHNHRILKSEKKTVTPSRACNCDKHEDCPLKGHWMGVQCVVYKATISAPNHADKYYYGLLSQSSKFAMLITNRLSNTPAREIRPSSPNTTGSCVIKVLTKGHQSWLAYRAKSPEIQVWHKKMRPVSNREACDSPSRQIYHAQQDIRDHISMLTQNQIQVS